MDAQKRAVITLSPQAATRTRELAECLNISMPEAVRRGLSLLRLAAELPEGAYLAVRTPSGEIERVLILGE